jgi:hypothetical protein
LKSLGPFLALLATIPDPRRAEGKLYQLPHVLLFSIFAIVSGANSYRGIQTYFKAHRQALNKAFKIKWRRAPAHTAIRYILQGLDATDVEKAFREHSANLNGAPDGAETCVIAFDGKTLKGPARIGTARLRSPTGNRAKRWFPNSRLKAGATSPFASRMAATSFTRSMQPANGCMASSIPQG